MNVDVNAKMQENIMCAKNILFETYYMHLRKWLIVRKFY